MMLLAREGGDPGLVFAAAGAYFGDDDETRGVGVERLLDDLIGDVRAVEVAGVDVVDSGGDGFAQDCLGGVYIAGGSPDVGAGELHGSVAHAVHGHGGVGEREGAA